MYQPQLQLPVQPTTPLVPNQMVIPFPGGIQPNFPIHPDVRLKKLAFYDILATLIQPKSLVPTNTQRVQESVHHFTLTPQQATDIASNRDIRNGSKIEHTIQVQLRFCLLETSCEQDDCFPPSIIVKVNNKLCPLPVSWSTEFSVAYGIENVSFALRILFQQIDQMWSQNGPHGLWMLPAMWNYHRQSQTAYRCNGVLISHVAMFLRRI